MVLYEIFTKTITAATVIVLGTPHECSDYAYKVLDTARFPHPLKLRTKLNQGIDSHQMARDHLRHSGIVCRVHILFLTKSKCAPCCRWLRATGGRAP